MNRNMLLAVCLCASMLASGCLNYQGEVEIPEVVLPDDWNDTTQRSASSPQLTAFDDCDDLENALKRSLEEEYRTMLLQAVAEQYYYGGIFFGDDEMAMDDAAADGAANSAGQKSAPTRVEGEDFSGTNNQEAGVDEADFLKTDGYHIYYLQGQYLHIFGVPEFGELEASSNMSISGTPVAMMLDGDRLVVISTLSPWSIPTSHPVVDAMGWDQQYGKWRTSSLTKFTVIDIADRTQPEVQRELFIEGYYITAREVQGTVRTITHAWMDVYGLTSWLELPNGYWNLDYDDPLRLEIRQKVAYQTMQKNAELIDEMTLADLIPQVYEFSNGTVTTHHMSDNACREFVAPEDGLNRGISSIFSLELASPTFDFEVDHVVGNYPQVYASTDVLVLAESAFDWWWFWSNDEVDEMTNLHTFDISSPDTTMYTGSGRVNGTVVNQFALSEYQGVLRVASTTGQWARWWMENPKPMSSQVVTLVRSMDIETEQQILVEAGRVDGIAPGERIWSARYDGDRAYIVTFQQMDPLWVIDLSDPTNPTVLGELEVPGVSTYIHPLSIDHLLTIGLSPANEDGTGLDWSGTQLSLFDVSDPEAPALSAALRLSPVNRDQAHVWTWSWSEATYESKAFQYWAPKHLLAIPLSTYRSVEWYQNGKYYWSYQYISKLILVEVNETAGTLEVYGEVNHSSLYDNTDGENRWWDDRNIRRSIFMGDFIYAISAAGITATNLTTMEESASLSIPYSSSYSYYYYGEDDTVVAVDGETKETGDAQTDSADEGGATSSSGSSSDEQ